VQVTGYQDIKTEADMVDALVNIGPLSVAIHASIGLQLYIGGIFNPNRCILEPNHGVLAVGYGNTGGTDWWKMKNSWGASWGCKIFVLIFKSLFYENNYSLNHF
jgi:C1A family cysteine protease